MRTITKEVYEYHELSAEGKEKVKREFEGMIVEDFSNAFREQANELVKKLFPRAEKVEYSLSSCQGDGLRFQFKINLIELKALLELMQNNPNKGEWKVFDDILEKLSKLDFIYSFGKKIDSFLSETSGIELLTDYEFIGKASKHIRYVYASSVEVDSNIYNLCDLEECVDEGKVVFIEELDNSLCTMVQQLFREICGILETMGYDEIYQEITDEYLNDMCQSNSYEFYEDGTQF